jgi:hypothetical protein
MEEMQPLRWDDGPPWEFRLRFPRDLSSGDLKMEGVLLRNTEELPLSAPLLLVPGLVLLPGVAARFDSKGAFHWVTALRNAGPIEIPATQTNELLDELVQFPAFPRGSSRRVAHRASHIHWPTMAPLSSR